MQRNSLRSTSFFSIYAEEARCMDFHHLNNSEDSHEDVIFPTASSRGLDQCFLGPGDGFSGLQ